MNQNSLAIHSGNNLNIVFILILAGLLVSCEKEPEPLTENSVIYGTAELYLDFENEPNHVKITAHGPYGQNSQIAGEDGSYRFSELGNGTYYLDFSQDGYGTIRQYGIQLFGYDTVHAETVQLYKKVGSFTMPTFTDAFSSTNNGNMCIWIETDLSSDDYAKGIPAILFFDTQNNVSFENYSYSFPAFDTRFFEVSRPTIFIETYRMPFKSGTRVYVIGYVCNMAEYNGYLDTYTGRMIYSTLDQSRHSNIISFIMP